MYITMKQCIEAIGQPINGVIHIGAHHGEEALDYSNNGVKKVLWVEANKKMMKHLYDKTCNLPIKSQYYCATLSNEDNEEVVLNITNNGQSTSILELGTHATQYPHITVQEKIKVRTKKFETLWRENSANINIDDYDFINLDVQGAELKVLEGFGKLYELADFKAIYTEINFEKVYKDCCLVEELDEFLGKFGFIRTLTAAPEGSWGDALYQKK